MKYKVTFLDYWHLSSGLSAGARFDSLVLKDENMIPFISGKTIKGLLKSVSNNKGFIKECFGEETKQGKCYFSNVTLEDKTAKTIKDKKLQNNLYDVIASTKIDENGIAQEKSLREIEVVVPISLYGEILNIPDTYKKKMKTSLSRIKRMGLNRNRGLGRCKIEVLGENR